MRFILAGDLTGTWADFGWIGPQTNHLSTALSLSITGRAGIARTYDYRAQRTVRELAEMRSTRADSAGILDAVRKETYGGVLRDSDPRVDARKKEKEEEKWAQEKARANKAKTNAAKQGAGDTDKTTRGPRFKKWSGDDRASGRKKQESHDTPGATKTDDNPEKEKKKKTDAT